MTRKLNPREQVKSNFQKEAKHASGNLNRQLTSLSDPRRAALLALTFYVRQKHHAAALLISPSKRGPCAPVTVLLRTQIDTYLRRYLGILHSFS